MKSKVIPSSWMNQEGRRLDCGPYMSGGIEVKAIVEKLRTTKVLLKDVTLGGLDGIYHAGRESRLWVSSLEYGVPFMSSSDILLSDLNNLPLISKKQILRNPKFIIREGWILITRSGSIGRMIYARKEMNGFACTEHVLRVIPDTERILPGYLYTYLNSKFGVPLVISGTYGSLIQSIEPHHLANIPVPRLGEKIENDIHKMLSEASEIRCNSNNTLRQAADCFNKLISDIDLTQSSPKISIISSSVIRKRFDAAFYDPVVTRIRNKIEEMPCKTIGEFCSRMFLPGIFKRIHTDDINYGAPYYSGASLFWLEPKPKSILSRKSTLFEDVKLERGTILVQAFGSDGGLIGRPVWVGSHLHGATTTHMLIRLNTCDKTMSGYLFAFLLSEAGYKQIASLSYGGAIPHLDEKGIATVLIPLLPENEMREISQQVIKALDERDRALSLELEARNLVEKTIEEACHG